jgi:hypothetical protein
LDDSTACLRAFNTLRQLTSDLTEKILKGRTEMDKTVANTLLGMSKLSLRRYDIFFLFNFLSLCEAHLYRWLSTPHSRLHDPALQKLIHSLMRKLFLQLINRIKTLGSNIVYANFKKVKQGQTRERSTKNK